LSEPLSPFWCGLSGAPGCVTWELILDGYSESSYSATPRFAAARLPWFSKSVELHDKVIGHYLNIKHYQ
ncbi:IS1 family transposase, partial [Klebsiella pneumoniae]